MLTGIRLWAQTRLVIPLFRNLIFWTQKSVPDRIPEDFFFSCFFFFGGISSHERGFGGGS